MSLMEYHFQNWLHFKKFIIKGLKWSNGSEPVLNGKYLNFDFRLWYENMVNIGYFGKNEKIEIFKIHKKTKLINININIICPK